MSDIVQVLDNAARRFSCALCPDHGVCAFCEPQIAQLRALRDRIEEDREAFLDLGRASAVFSDRTGFAITLTDKVKVRDSVATERALLTICREVTP